MGVYSDFVTNEQTQEKLAEQYVFLIHKLNMQKSLSFVQKQGLLANFLKEYEDVLVDREGHGGDGEFRFKKEGNPSDNKKVLYYDVRSVLFRSSLPQEAGQGCVIRLDSDEKSGYGDYSTDQAGADVTGEYAGILDRNKEFKHQPIEAAAGNSGLDPLVLREMRVIGMWLYKHSEEHMFFNSKNQLEGKGVSNKAMFIDTIMRRPAREKLFIFYLAEKGRTGNYNEEDILKSQTQYIPDFKAFKEKVKSHGVSGFFKKRIGEHVKWSVLTKAGMAADREREKFNQMAQAPDNGIYHAGGEMVEAGELSIRANPDDRDTLKNVATLQKRLVNITERIKNQQKQLTLAATDAEKNEIKEEIERLNGVYLVTAGNLNKYTDALIRKLDERYGAPEKTTNKAGTAKTVNKIGKFIAGKLKAIGTLVAKIGTEKKDADTVLGGGITESSLAGITQIFNASNVVVKAYETFRKPQEKSTADNVSNILDLVHSAGTLGSGVNSLTGKNLQLAEKGAEAVEKIGAAGTGFTIGLGAMSVVEGTLDYMRAESSLNDIGRAKKHLMSGVQGPLDERTSRKKNYSAGIAEFAMLHAHGQKVSGTVNAVSGAASVISGALSLFPGGVLPGTVISAFGTGVALAGKIYSLYHSKYKYKYRIIDTFLHLDEVMLKIKERFGAKQKALGDDAEKTLRSELRTRGEVSYGVSDDDTMVDCISGWYADYLYDETFVKGPNTYYVQNDYAEHEPESYEDRFRFASKDLMEAFGVKPEFGKTERDKPKTTKPVIKAKIKIG